MNGGQIDPGIKSHFNAHLYGRNSLEHHKGFLFLNEYYHKPMKVFPRNLDDRLYLTFNRAHSPTPCLLLFRVQ